MAKMKDQSEAARIDAATEAGDLVSTYCGSMTPDELAQHILECEVCRKDFE